MGILVLGMLLMAATAYAAVGDLTPQGCIDDNDSGPDTCAASGDGMSGGVSPAVSPDGRSVYGVSFTDDAIVRFDRDTTTGALTYVGCIDDNDSGADTCADSGDGLDQPRGIAISPDGASVYVASQIDDAVVRFDRDTTTGALTYQGCIDDNDAGEGPDGCAGSTGGLNGAVEVDVSPDGTSVYAVSAGDDGVVTFNRAPGGALTPAGCIEDDDTGTDGECAKTAGLNDTGAVQVSPDGKSVYAAGFSDDAIVRFDRATGGGLTAQGCIDDDDTGADTCATSTDGLDNAIGIAVTPDNKSVYVAANADDALARFDRDTSTGALTPQGCIGDNDTGDDPGCSNTVDGLDGIFHVVSSPGGATIYTSAQQDSAVARFDRATTGALTPNGCVDDNDTGADACAISTDGLGGAGWADVSPNGLNLYVGAGADSSIVTFGRDSEPITGGGGGGGGGSNDTDPPETKITKKPKKKLKSTRKAKAVFKFKSDEAGSKFQCKLTGKKVKKKLKKFRPCNSGKQTYKKLKLGKKQFLVRAIDPAGNVDPTPAKYKWKVVAPRKR